ncbi:hypothetical protein KAU45_02545 [bacterium]|nr:hypothetical protein [bacterium]
MHQITLYLFVLTLFLASCGESVPEDVYEVFVRANNDRDAEDLVGCLWFAAWDGFPPDEVARRRRELVPTAEREYFLDRIVDHEVIQIEETSDDARRVLIRQVFLDPHGNRHSDQYWLTLVRRGGDWFIFVPEE